LMPPLRQDAGPLGALELTSGDGLGPDGVASEVSWVTLSRTSREVTQGTATNTPQSRSALSRY
jgi:hypothetical protein